MMYEQAKKIADGLDSVGRELSSLRRAVENLKDPVFFLDLLSTLVDDKSLSSSARRPTSSTSNSKDSTCLTKEARLVKEKYPQHRLCADSGIVSKVRLCKKSGDTVDEIITGIQAWKSSAGWKKDNGVFVPNLSKFLSRKDYKRVPPDAQKGDGDYQEAFK